MGHGWVGLRGFRTSDLGFRNSYECVVYSRNWSMNSLEFDASLVYSRSFIESLNDDARCRQNDRHLQLQPDVPSVLRFVPPSALLRDQG